MSSTSTLSLQGLRKTYQVEGQALPVLDDINLDIAPGEFVSIVGSSGCGKSTLLRLLIGLENSFDGHILLDGQPVAGTGLERGIVFQDHRLFPWLTVEQNVGLALENNPRSPREKAAAIAEHI
ncbi:ATP-binding cassette domain-containing protein, partial [Zoogloea sp.]|uniref:ATP-binding cassette domain-containing protein n=1 Tax=Zoogloea sp. TaxID=49181 RepID=UPI0025E0632C